MSARTPSQRQGPLLLLTLWVPRAQVFTGPPESVRDHIMAAARALGRGDWEKAYHFITALKMWAVMPDREAVMAMLKQKLKVEGLRTYLFAYSSQYKALSLSLLANLFQLSEKEVRPHPDPPRNRGLQVEFACNCHSCLPSLWPRVGLT